MPKNKETQQTEQCPQHLRRKECLHAVVVIDALQQIPHQFGIEERHGQLQQFDKEIADQRDIDAHGDVQQQPSPDKVHHGAANDNHKFAQQHHPNKSYILTRYAHVHNGLR